MTCSRQDNNNNNNSTRCCHVCAYHNHHCLLIQIRQRRCPEKAASDEKKGQRKGRNREKRSLSEARSNVPKNGKRNRIRAKVGKYEKIAAGNPKRPFIRNKAHADHHFSSSERSKITRHSYFSSSANPKEAFQEKLLEPRGRQRHQQQTGVAAKNIHVANEWRRPRQRGKLLSKDAQPSNLLSPEDELLTEDDGDSRSTSVKKSRPSKQTKRGFFSVRKQRQQLQQHRRGGGNEGQKKTSLSNADDGRRKSSLRRRRFEVPRSSPPSRGYDAIKDNGKREIRKASMSDKTFYMNEGETTAVKEGKTTFSKFRVTGYPKTFPESSPVGKELPHDNDDDDEDTMMMMMRKTFSSSSPREKRETDAASAAAAELEAKKSKKKKGKNNKNKIKKSFEPLATVTMEVPLLRPQERLRFQPYDPASSWSVLEAMEQTRLAFTAWDAQNSNDNQQQKTMNINLPFCCDAVCNHSGGILARDFATIYIEKEDCDGTAVVNEPREFDKCGVCGGGDDCVDCNGVPNGGSN